MKTRKLVCLLLITILAFCSACSDSETEAWKQALYEQVELDLYQELPVDEPILAAYVDEQKSGMFIVSKALGYHGDVVVLVRYADKVVEQVRILEESETEDYGGYIREQWFLERFKGMNPGQKLRLVKMAKDAENEVVGVTGATVSSQAVLEAVQATLQYMQDYKGGN
ncbi:FMN-binding protein [Clostridia bacterium]|nr:FMN-binding protein [Clostridia bacterium]